MDGKVEKGAPVREGWKEMGWGRGELSIVYMLGYILSNRLPLYLVTEGHLNSQFLHKTIEGGGSALYNKGDRCVGVSFFNFKAHPYE